MSNLSSMRAAWYEELGPANEVLILGERDKPSAAPGEVLVRLYCSAVNPSDVKKRAGKAGSGSRVLTGGPIIPNSDGAGIVEAVGEGVSNSRIGERVWIYQAQFSRPFGTAAEFIAIDDARAPKLPRNVDFDVGACLGIPAMTAHRCVFADGPVSGQRILVTGGAGRVGHYAIQWASQGGATVIATASNDDDVQACKSAGAQFVVNHRDEKFPDAVLDASGGEPVDRVVDVSFGANLTTAIAVLRVGGCIATYSSAQVPEPKLPVVQMMYKDLTVRFVIVYAMPEAAKRSAVVDIDKALGEDRLQHRVAKKLPFDDIVKCNQIVEQSKVRGAVLLAID